MWLVTLAQEGEMLKNLDAAVSRDGCARGGDGGWGGEVARDTCVRYFASCSFVQRLVEGEWAG